MRHSALNDASLLQALQHDGCYFPLLRTMDRAHRLVLRWCAYLSLEDVLRIDRKWLFGSELRAGRSRRRRLMLATERLPQILVPCALVATTENYAIIHEQDADPFPEPEDPIFDEVNGKPITRASLYAAVERALLLVPPPAPTALSRQTGRRKTRRRPAARAAHTVPKARVESIHNSHDSDDAQTGLD